MSAETPTLRERIAAITAEVKITATGTTGAAAGNRRAISIGDVDAALGALMAKHGVVSDFEFLGEPVVAFELPTRNEGVLRMWKVHIAGIVQRADAEGDEGAIRRELWDVGSSPSGAVSFALKRWQRALFRLAEDDDQVDHDTQKRARENAQPPSPQGADRQPQSDEERKRYACAKCGVVGAVHRLRQPNGDKVAFCKKHDGGCGAYLTREQVRRTDDLPPATPEDDAGDAPSQGAA